MAREAMVGRCVNFGVCSQCPECRRQRGSRVEWYKVAYISLAGDYSASQIHFASIGALSGIYMYVIVAVVHPWHISGYKSALRLQSGCTFPHYGPSIYRTTSTYTHSILYAYSEAN
ncbi:hypothetical protein P167DRAFT_205167 [Morchella conica CCBAS932]|uniref:Uncharacterized protein n=1 Tax=Morchella conica CCBAS932 TaxID=1392247 RepID=A0A3N4L2L2_9PEZI|nr:hypothetical protein P167DRAFT_205167 [Morchella conica CCBAS932]